MDPKLDENRRGLAGENAMVRMKCAAELEPERRHKMVSQVQCMMRRKMR
jgi:hypothetical protein